MATRITLISNGATSATRNATFPANEPLEEKAIALAAGLAGTLPAVDRIYCSPDLAGAQTAKALGLTAEPEPLLREIDFGDWAGKSLTELQAEDALALSAWVMDPQTTPPGGESAVDLIMRVSTWLAHQADQSSRIIAVIPANCLRAAVIHCLQAPAIAFRQIDVPPLSSIFLSCHRGQWRLRLSSQGLSSQD
jgi:broad specificity phosphatase PhoE